ncbi:MAG: caspase family protein [Candidatus Thioglobus sp.]|jgi:hypothetical protein
MQMVRLIFTLITLSICSTSFAKEKIALVIGNADYTSSALVNSVNDAEDIASTLENLDFGVTLVKNATKDKMQTAISEFVKSLNDDTVGLFYYSGHAVQYKGSNYLIPIGSVDKTNHVKDLPKNTVNTNTVLDGLNQSQSNLNFVFLDACRDNPFKNLSKEITPGLAKTSVGARSVSTNLIMKDLSITRGVSETHEQVKDTKGILVAYSTMPGSVASDGSGRNSPYTKSLLKHITKTNSLAQIMLSDVQQDVQQSTNGRQIPVLESAITGRFCFNEVDNSCGVSGSFLDGLSDIVKLKLADGSSYEGQVKGGLPHGKGVQIYSNEVDNPRFFNRYEGEWKNGLPDGVGKAHHSSGTYYTGEWKDGDLHGQGSMIYFNGARFDGRFEYGDGSNGFYRYENGVQYIGDMKGGEPHGKGRRTELDGSYYETIFDQGKRDENAHIVHVMPNGYRYEGDSKNNLPDGKGSMTWVDGSHYQGNWRKGKQDGFGVLTWASGDTASGEWNQDALIKGLMVYADGSHKMGEWNDKGEENGVVISKKANGDYIETHSKNGVPYGSSIILLNDGTRFEGELNWDAVTKYGKNPANVDSLKKDKTIFKTLYSSKHAIVTRPGGFRYEGALKDGEPDGYGIGSYGNSRRIEGEFKNGLPHGHIIEVIDGVRWEGEYLNGAKVEESDKTSNSVSNFLKNLFH